MKNNIFLYIQRKLAVLDEHTLEVFKKSFSSTIVKVIGMILGLVLSIFLGRTIGAEGLGIINLSNRIVNILLIVGLFGMRSVIVKEVAIAKNKNNLIHVGNVMHSAYWLNGGITIILTVISIILSPFIANHIFKEPNLTYPLAVALSVMIPQVFSRIFSSSLIGYKKIWQSNLVDQTLSIAVTLLILLILWAIKIEISIILVAISYAIGRIVVTIIVWLYWKTLFYIKSEKTTITKSLIKVAFPLFISTISTAIIGNSDTIIIGIIGNASEVGLYTVAMSIALLTSFFLQITDAAVGPKIAALYEEGKLQDVEKMLQKVTLGLFLLGSIPFLIYLVAGKAILGLWGNEFSQAYSILIVLSFGQLIKIGTGPVAQLLIMTGHHKENTYITVAFMVVNIVLNILLIKYYGLMGAAIAAFITIVGTNIARLIVSIRKTKISILSISFKSIKI